MKFHLSFPYSFCLTLFFHLCYQLIENWISRCPDHEAANVTSATDGDASSPASCMDNYTVTLIWSWVVAIFCIGGMLGGTMVGFIARSG